MPYPHNFIKVSLLASWASFLITTPSQIANASVDFWARANSRVPNGWYLNSVKYALINEEGRYDDQDAHEEEVEPTPGGGTLGWAPTFF